MKQSILMVLWMLIFTGCKREIPADMIQPAEMEKILYSIHLADGMVSNIPQADSAKTIAAAYYKGIYKKFKVDSVLFAKSMEYYYDNPVMMTKVYDGVVARLEEEKKKIDDEESRKQMAIYNRNRSIEIRDSLTRLLFVDTTIADKLKLDTIKINYAKMTKAEIRTIQSKNDSIKVKIDSAKKAADKKKEFVIQPRRAFFWGKK